MEINLCSLQETIFKVVEVEKYRIAIESRLRIAVGKIKSISTCHLNLRQLTDGTTQQLLLLQRVTTTSLTTASDGIEQRYGAQIGLDIAQLIATDSKDGRDRQLAISKVLGQIDEGMVLVATGTDAADDTFTFGRGHTVVFTITATCSQLLYILGFCPTPLLI